MIHMPISLRDRYVISVIGLRERDAFVTLTLTDTTKIVILLSEKLVFIQTMIAERGIIRVKVIVQDMIRPHQT